MKRLVMMIGLPASGKSTIARKNFNDAYVVSTDAIRGELFGDESIQGDPNKVFDIAKTRMVDALNGDCETVIFDATNLRKKYRIPLIAEIRKRVKTEFAIDALWIAVPYEECLKRDKERERNVGEDVIRRMYLNFEPCGYEEGFDDIIIHFNCNEQEMAEYSADQFISKALPFDQHNKHHTLTLGQHCISTRNYVRSHGGDNLVCSAALIHDCGKLFTESFKNHKGEITEECHYYQHHCVGAYDSVFYTRNICGQESGGYESAAYIANLIFYHMHPLLNWKNNEKKMKKDTEKMNAGFVKDLMLLHEADVQAH